MLLFIEIFTTISVILVVFTTYLSINKLWIRKHEPEVADSISISSSWINLSVSITSLLINVYNVDYGDVISYFIWTILFMFYAFLGIGLWVDNGLTVKEKVKRAFKMDRKESTVIIKDLLHITSIEKVLVILYNVALVDGLLHEKEEKLLRGFAKQHGINYEDAIADISKTLKGQDTLKVMYNLKHEIESYLKSSPQKKVVTWLQDLINMLVKCDDDVSIDEKIMVSEIQGLFINYINQMSGSKKKIKMYNLILVPQASDKNFDAIAKEHGIDKLKEKVLYGSEVSYIADSYYSEDLAEKSREEYVKFFNCFVTIEKF